MSIFSNIFGKKSESDLSHPKWKYITSENDLDKANAESFEKKVVIFKHSTRCFISKTVLKNFEKQIDSSDKDFSFYFLDLIAHRPISNKIEEDYKVTHQSPQVIVLQDGVSVQNASHQNIDLDNIF